MTTPLAGTPSRLARLFKSAAGIEPYELKAVILSVLFFFLPLLKIEWVVQ